MNTEPTVKWTVHVITDDFYALLCMLRRVNRDLADHARNNASPLHDDDPDGIINVYIEVFKLRELRIALNAIDGLRCVKTVCVYVSVDNEAGIRTEASIGDGAVIGDDASIGGKVVVAKAARTKSAP